MNGKSDSGNSVSGRWRLVLALVLIGACAGCPSTGGPEPRRPPSNVLQPYGFPAVMPGLHQPPALEVEPRRPPT